MEICRVPDCRFFANQGCYGTCSSHSKYKSVKMISIIYPFLPKEILDLIWEFFYVDPFTSLGDEEIIALLGAHRFVESQKVDELVYRFSNARLPYIHCDNPSRALLYLSLQYRQKFTCRNATRIIEAIITMNPHEHTLIAFQKVLVLLTVNNVDLPNELFGVGKCYFGGRALKKSMSREHLLGNLRYNDSLSSTYIGY